jgi:hypothetical protein
LKGKDGKPSTLTLTMEWKDAPKAWATSRGLRVGGILFTDLLPPDLIFVQD